MAAATRRRHGPASAYWISGPSYAVTWLPTMSSGPSGSGWFGPTTRGAASSHVSGRITASMKATRIQWNGFHHGHWG